MTPTPKPLSTVIEHALLFMLKQQTPSGRFNSLAAHSVNCINDDFETFNNTHQVAWVTPDNFSIFPSLLVAASLQHIPPTYQNKHSQLILRKLYQYIQVNRRPSGLWNHFEAHTKQFKVCPHDIDSTAYASAVLKQANLLTNPVNNIISKHISPQKLFYTFFTFRSQVNTSLTYWWVCLRETLHPIHAYFFWRIQELNRYDIDAVVNANVLYYLGPSKLSTAPLQWIIHCIQTHQENTMDKWYKNPWVIYYFVTRLIERGFNEPLQLKPHIMAKFDADQQPNGSILHKALDTALAINVLLNVNEPAHRIQPLVDFLVANQQNDGEWPARVMYTGGHKRIMGWGGKPLTTAICIEALSRFAHRFPNTN